MLDKFNMGALFSFPYLHNSNGVICRPLGIDLKKQDAVYSNLFLDAILLHIYASSPIKRKLVNNADPDQMLQNTVPDQGLQIRHNNHGYFALSM